MEFCPSLYCPLPQVGVPLIATLKLEDFTPKSLRGTNEKYALLLCTDTSVHTCTLVHLRHFVCKPLRFKVVCYHSKTGLN
jgi:hypothetical protein